MSLANVIKPASSLPKYTHQDFPALFWNQETGEPVTVKDEASIPAGYKPYHPNSAPKAAAPAPATNALPLNKDEVLAALKEGGIPHNPAQSHGKLYNLLLAAVKAALDEAKVTYDAAETNVKALLALLPSE